MRVVLTKIANGTLALPEIYTLFLHRTHVKLITDKEIFVEQKNNILTVKLPLISVQHESIDHRG
jgi:hypothetical protein